MGNGAAKAKVTYDEDGNEVPIKAESEEVKKEEGVGEEIKDADGNVILDKDGQPKTKVDNQIRLVICPFCHIEIADFTLVKARSGIKILVKCKAKEREKTFKIENFLDTLEVPSKTIPKNCSSNDHQEKGEIFCPECAEWFCRECLRYHLKYCKDHKVTDHHINVNCPKHKKDFIFYCHDCSKSVCIECQFPHNNHNLETLTSVDITKLTTYNKIFQEIIDRNADIGKRFIMRIDAEISTATIKTKLTQLSFWKKDIKVVFDKNEESNLLLQFLVDYIVLTANAFKGHPDYTLIKIVKALKINDNVPNIDGKKLDDAYHFLKTFYSNNFALCVDTQEQTIAKARETNTSCLRTGFLHEGTINCMIQIFIKNEDKDEKSDTARKKDKKEKVDNNSLICSGSNDTTIKLWDHHSFKCTITLKGHLGAVFCLLEAQYGSVFSGSYDDTIRLWNWMKGECLGILKGHSGAINDMILIEQGSELPILASASYDSTIKIWSLETISCKKTADTHDWSVQCLLYLSNGKIASGSLDKTIKLWQSKPFKCKASMAGHIWGVTSLVELIDGNLASSSMDSTIKIWNMNELKCLQTIEGHTERIVRLLQLNDGGLASCSHDKTVRLWKKEKYTCFSILKGHNYLVTSLMLMKNGILISGALKEVKLWNM